jgi:hypothetical protein
MKIFFNPERYRENKVRSQKFPAKFDKEIEVNVSKELTYGKKKRSKIKPAE